MDENMTREERKKYCEKLGIKPKKVEEHDREDQGVDVVEEADEEKERKEEEQREKELEQYREVSGF